MREVRGLQLVDLPEIEQCCGFGGTFAIKNADVSSAMLADKARQVLNTGAEVCTAVDNSCLMHIYGGCIGSAFTLDGPSGGDPRANRQAESLVTQLRGLIAI